MTQFNSKQSAFNYHKGFNLIEILLALSFFSLAFSGMLLGSTAMISTSTNGTKLNEDSAVTGSMFMGVNPNSAYVEAAASQLTTQVASTASISLNTPGDISSRQVITIPDNTASTTDNRKLYFDRLVYSMLNTPDIKTVQLNMYNQPDGGVSTKSIIRKLDRREECFAMGVDGPLYLPSFGQPCTGWSSGRNVPQSKELALTGPAGQQNFTSDFRINGATSALVTGNTLSLYEETAGATPINPTDRGHQVANGTEAVYWVEATPNVAYNLILGLRKQTTDQIYTVSINGIYGAAIDCNITNRPRNCQRETITRTPQDLVDKADGEAFSVIFKNIMPFSVGNRRVFRITVVSTGGTAANNPAVIHYIKKELARN